MKRVLILVVMLFGLASAQGGLDLQILECSVIGDDTDRLACYDDLASQATSSDSDTSNAWNIDSDTNPLDDSTSMILYTEASEGEGQYGEPITLVLRCIGGRVDAAIFWNHYLGLETTEVTYRIGTGEARTDTWYISNNSESTFYSQSEEIDRRFIQELAEADTGRFVAQVWPYNESRVTAIFDISGLEDIVGQLYETCSE